MLPQTETDRSSNKWPSRSPALQMMGAQESVRANNGWSLAVAVIAVAALLISGIWSRVRAGAALHTETAQAALTAVSVVSPKQTAPAEEIILPGNVQPYITSPIYARTNGYLKKWYFDIGAHVKQGQLACRHRDARSRSATRASPQQPVNRASQSRVGFHHQNAVSGAAEKQRCVPTGRR